MAGHVGLEPTTYRLTAECSTIELMSMAGAVGFEPTEQMAGSEPAALPLGYAP